MQVKVFECDGCRKRVDKLPVGWMYVLDKLYVVRTNRDMAVEDAIFCSLECIKMALDQATEPA